MQTCYKSSATDADISLIFSRFNGRDWRLPAQIQPNPSHEKEDQTNVHPHSFACPTQPAHATPRERPTQPNHPQLLSPMHPLLSRALPIASRSPRKRLPLGALSIQIASTSC
ncbi:hypothetical protein C8Q80DRAFT_1183045 [Daedaleopsis nitida]|nr:hypothetical protein C8Q80DRAFT_1183045 [Daedaleopsis nitida]